MGLPRYRDRSLAPRQWVQDMLTIDMLVRANEQSTWMHFLANLMGAELT